MLVVLLYLALGVVAATVLARYAPDYYDREPAASFALAVTTWPALILYCAMHYAGKAVRRYIDWVRPVR